MNNYDLIVIGGGPAGLMAAGEAAENGLRVLLLEKQKRCGLKLLISGAGKCNVSNSLPYPEFFSKYNNPNFVKRALYFFDLNHLKKFFLDRGVSLKELENGKVFPVSEKASDILKVLIDHCRKNNVLIIKDAPVKKILHKDDSYEVITPLDKYFSRKLVIACGGKSYPKTGSEGDVKYFTEYLNHSCTELIPALCSIEVEKYFFTQCSGISIRNVVIELYREGRKQNSFTGDLLFTHTGLSGPVILSNSHKILKNDKLKINFFKKNYTDTDKYLLDIFQKEKKKYILNALKYTNLPESFLRVILKEIGIKEEKGTFEITREERKKISKNLSSMEFIVTKSGNFSTAMATSGGVSLKEIFPSTMESRLSSGLYWVGESLDIHADTGGFNIHFALASGKLAGKSAAEKSKKSSL